MVIGTFSVFLRLMLLYEGDWDVKLNELSEAIIGAGIEVHREIGPGLLESAYEGCLCYELDHRGLRFTRQQPLPVVYKGVHLDCGYQMDLVVENKIILELKSVARLLPIHQAQLLTYLKLTNLTLGLLMNFNVFTFTSGIRRVVNNFHD